MSKIHLIINILIIIIIIINKYSVNGKHCPNGLFKNTFSMGVYYNYLYQFTMDYKFVIYKLSWIPGPETNIELKYQPILVDVKERLNLTEDRNYYQLIFEKNKEYFLKYISFGVQADERIGSKYLFHIIDPTNNVHSVVQGKFFNDTREDLQDKSNSRLDIKKVSKIIPVWTVDKDSVDFNITSLTFTIDSTKNQTVMHNKIENYDNDELSLGYLCFTDKSKQFIFISKELSNCLSTFEIFKNIRSAFGYNERILLVSIDTNTIYWFHRKLFENEDQQLQYSSMNKFFICNKNTIANSKQLNFNIKYIAVIIFVLICLVICIYSMKNKKKRKNFSRSKKQTSFSY